MSRRKGKATMYMAVTKRDPEIDMFLDMREEERLQEEECIHSILFIFANFPKTSKQVNS